MRNGWKKMNKISISIRRDITVLSVEWQAYIRTLLFDKLNVQAWWNYCQVILIVCSDWRNFTLKVSNSIVYSTLQTDLFLYSIPKINDSLLIVASLLYVYGVHAFHLGSTKTINTTSTPCSRPPDIKWHL